MSKLVSILKVDHYTDILEEIENILKEKAKTENRCKALEADVQSLKEEFQRKKLGGNKYVLDKTKSFSHNRGIIYMNKQHIGKRVIVWEK